MILSDNTFIDISIKDSGKYNFINEQNLEKLILVQTAGASLPYISFSFTTTDTSIIQYFNENNDVQVSIGNGVQDADKLNVQLLIDPKKSGPANDTGTVNAGGFLCSRPYMVDRGECRAYNGNSLMVAKQILKRFKGISNRVDSDFEKVDENQVVWRQLFETASTFLVRVLLHMNVQPSFPLFSFDKYGKFHIRDYNKLIKEGPTVKFTPYEPDKDSIKYLNTFDVDSFKPSYNLYSGYNKVTEIYGVEEGIPAYTIADNVPILSSSKEAETSKSGNRISLNKIQSANVHSKYEEAYAYNTNRLISLSSMQGVLLIAGYHPELKPTDLVYVETPKENGLIGATEGKYLIDTVVFAYSVQDKIPKTYVYVTRDNDNNIENFVTEKEVKNKNSIKIKKVKVQNLVNAVARTRTALATCAQIMDGTFIQSLRNYVTEARNNLLRCFSVSGIIMDFTSQARMLQSALLLGNNLMNILVEMLFPSEVASLLKNFLINDTSMRGLVSNAIYEHVPFELQGLVTALVDSLCEVHDSLNSIAKDNGITTKEVPEMLQGSVEYTEDDNKVGKIIDQFEKNTTGLDVPFPIINLTESQKLLPEKDLEEYVALETISNLTDLGYLTGLSESDVEELKDILLGKEPINFALIDKINRVAGEKYNYRFWGTYGAANEALYAWTYNDKMIFTKQEEVTIYTRLYNNDYSPYLGTAFKVAKNDKGEYKIYYNSEEVKRKESEDVISNALSQLTDFYINKGYKDRYRTIPCTKLISATKNARLYFACPVIEEDIKFYINSKRVELESFPIDLGYTDVYGNKLIYNVYYTTTGYNSNSTMLEVRQ